MGKRAPNCRRLAHHRKKLTAASRGSPLVPIDRGGHGGGDDNGDWQSPDGDWPEDSRKGTKSPPSVAMSRVAIAAMVRVGATTRIGGGLKMLGVVGGVNLGSQIG